MDIRTGSVSFGKDKGTGPRTGTTDVDFGQNISNAFAVLTGMDFGFSPRDDHHLGVVDIKVDAAVLGTVARVTATLGVRDWSDDWDDDYEGTVYFAVLAE